MLHTHPLLSLTYSWLRKFCSQNAQIWGAALPITSHLLASIPMNAITLIGYSALLSRSLSKDQQEICPECILSLSNNRNPEHLNFIVHSILGCQEDGLNNPQMFSALPQINGCFKTRVNRLKHLLSFQVTVKLYFLDIGKTIELQIALQKSVNKTSHKLNLFWW